MDMTMFQREQGYRLCLSVLERLRDKGLLTAEEFVQARAVLIENTTRQSVLYLSKILDIA